MNNPITLLRNPGYLRVWGLGLIGNTMRWLETLAIGIFVYEITASALLVAAMTIFRQVPLALFGSFIGPIAENMNRKYLLILGFTVITCSLCVLLLLEHYSALEIWHIGLCVFVNGTCWSLDYPVRRTLVGEFAGPDKIGGGISLDSATNNVTRMLGPGLGGVVFGYLGLQGAFLISAIAHFLCIIIAASLVVDFPSMHKKVEPYFKMLGEGVRLVKGSPRLIGIFIITIILNIFGFPYASMVPVLGRSVYEVEPALVGILSGAEGAGAFIGALVVAFLIRPRWFGRVYLYGAVTFVFGIFFISFGAQMALTIVSSIGLIALATVVALNPDIRR